MPSTCQGGKLNEVAPRATECGDFCLQKSPNLLGDFEEMAFRNLFFGCVLRRSQPKNKFLERRLTKKDPWKSILSQDINGAKMTQKQNSKTTSNNAKQILKKVKKND